MAFNQIAPFNVALMLLIPTYETVSGVRKKTYPDVNDGIRINGTFKTYGGTEHDVNGVYSVEDTAQIVTWYRPDIESGCRIAVAGTSKVYDVIGEPENIDLRNQYLSFKVMRVKGGA